MPSQNFVYADVDGHIGYYAPGRIPIRASGDGTMPAEGWTGDSEWTGWVPFEDLPHAFDPPSTPSSRPINGRCRRATRYLLGVDWPEPYRAQRITDLLRANAQLTPDDFAAIQADTLSLHAQTLLPVLLEVRSRNRRPTVRRSTCCDDGIMTRAATARPRRSLRRGFCGWRRPWSATSSGGDDRQLRGPLFLHHAVRSHTLGAQSPVASDALGTLVRRHTDAGA